VNIDEARELLGDEDTFTLFADGFDEAFLGLAYRNYQTLAVYSTTKALEMCEQQMEESCDGSDHDECEHWSEGLEYFNVNVVAAWVGEGTPLWLEDSIDA